jgi:ferritin-like metal-binding protein YciE
MQLNTLDDVFVDQIEDLYSAEQQLVAALPKMAQAATSPELREAFEHHLEETRAHVSRLEQIFETAGITRAPETCEAMQGLIEEGSQVIQTPGDPMAKDAALIAAAQRVEHYEIAAYGTAKTLAHELGYGEAEATLDDTLGDEGRADKLLTKIATGGLFASGVNREAMTRRS